MELTTAVDLIKGGIDNKLIAQTWVDLGAGNGLFTKALATLLDQNSTVFAIDRDAAALSQLPDQLSDVSVQKIIRDFSKEEITEGPFDGILMANSLHFVKDQFSLLTQLGKKMKPNARMILIEYDMDKSNPWVPYPISFNAMIKLAKQIGFESVKRLGQTPSAYNRANIYSVLLKVIQ
jgi:2-polyprenyl-3-methyl-5-hydroxy-6-metoxy-1,4-benzoquinol methylase